MEPLLIILIPGIFGGLVLALLIRRNWRGTPPTFVAHRLEAPSPGLINMSSIKVEGIGGLGMVAAVAAVAIADPRIGLATILALVLGGGLALVLIAMRRRAGSSTGESPDDRSTLRLDDDRRRTHLTGVQATIDEAKRTGMAAGHFKSFA